jgi:large subunit ribosomal protein L32
MTPLPKRRWSTRRQGKRRAAQTAGALTLVKCKNCGQLKQSHTICPNCGFYRGKSIKSVNVQQTTVSENQK